jgi:regulator of protease activity HflC (stomatin/prohibitin superfamily)
MAETQTGSSAPEDYAQLTQAQVPLDEAVDAFATRDASGRIPIVVVPQQLNRIRNELVGLALLILIGGIALGILFDNAALLIPVAVGLAIILFVVGIYRSFMVRIPEGVNGLLARGGRYIRTLGSGTHIIPPWIVVSHLVTRREIPFDVPVLEVPTQDNVRANVDILITFSITEPYEFVYSISADDFDQVFQAICQDSLRAMVRQITSDEVINLTHHDMEGLRDVLGAAVESYGIKVMKINVTYAQPPAGFMQSQEARKLAALQQAEQAETQALAQRRQTDDEALARQKVVAQVEREREALQAQVQQAEARRRIVELEAEAEELRLAKLEERLAKYPHAAAWEVEGLRLEIGRALAGNTRAILQVGSASDIVRTFLMRDNLQDKPVSPADGSLVESQEQ